MVPNPSSLTPLFAIVARPVGEHIIKKIKSKINPSEIEQAIKAGLLAADQEDSQFPYEKHLFHNSTVDGLNGVKAFFGKYFEIEAVQEELAKPFNNEASINIEYLTKEFNKISSKYSEVKPVEDRIKPWLTTFTKVYIENLSFYLKLQVAKENYFKQLSKRYDNIKFAGIAVSGEEEVKDLQRIFVMPDVSEIESNKTTFTKDFKLTIDGGEQKLSSLEREKLDSQLVKSNPPFLAKKLLTETSNKKAILLGSPGSGKSTLVSYFAVMLAQEKAEELGLDNQVDWLPIVIEVRDLEKNLNLKIIDYIHEYAEKNLVLPNLLCKTN